jgi:hypothetical protein
VTLRHNLSDWDNPNNDVGDQPLSLFESRSSIRSTDHQSLLAVRSELGASAQNELKLGLSFSDRELTPNSLAPRGFVRVRSALPDGSTGDVRLQFGGNRLAPERSGERQVQLINTTWITRGRHTLALRHRQLAHAGCAPTSPSSRAGCSSSRRWPTWRRCGRSATRGRCRWRTGSSGRGSRCSTPACSRRRSGGPAAGWWRRWARATTSRRS